MKILRAMKFSALGLASLFVFTFGFGLAHAATVTFGTTGSFDGSLSTLNSAITFGNAGNTLTITYNGLPTGTTVDASPTTFGNLGQFVVSVNGTGSTIALNTTFVLTVNQTVPSGGSGVFSAMASGVISQNSSTGMVSFSVSSISIGSVTYSLTNSQVALAPPSTNGGVSTIGARISTSAPPDLTITKTHAGSFTQGQVGATYTITVSNGAAAGPTDGSLVTVTDVVPSGLTAFGIGGTNWSCVQPAGPCTRSEVLAGGANYPVLTLTVIVGTNAASPQINTASVTGGGDNTPGNNTASDTTAIVAPLPTTTRDIPTLSRAALLLLALMVLGFGVTLRRRAG